MTKNDNNTSLSIIVCTFNRADLLNEALNSLVLQTADKNLFEVIIVDNNSTDTTRIVAKDYALKHSNFRYVFEEKQGLSHARNRGYQESTSDWISYLDDDAKASKNYVERMLHVIKNYNFDCFGGVYLPWYKYGKPKWYKDRYGSNGFKLKRTGILLNDYASGGIIVFKRSVLEDFNGFSVSIGMSGGKIAYGEETKLQVKMRKKGYIIGFDPKLRIQHLVDHNKLKPSWYILSSFAKGRDSWVTFELDVTLEIVFRLIASTTLFFSLNLCIYTLKLFTKGYYFQNWIIDLGTPIAVATGQLSSSIRHLKIKK